MHNSRLYLIRNNLIDTDCKIKCPLRIKNGPLLINYGPLCIKNGPLRIKNVPLRINNGPLRIKNGPLRKNHEMQHFAYKNTYIEVIFDLYQKKKIYVKIRYSGYDSGKNVLLVIDPFWSKLDFSIPKVVRD